MAALTAWFWNERFWLPHNVTWADLADPEPGVEYPKAGHVLSALPLALGIFAVRILFERFIARPCAFLLRIQASGHRVAQPNTILEKVFTSITKTPWLWDTRQCWYNYPYQAAKMANYAKYQHLCDMLFVGFAMVFVGTRLGIYPLCVSIAKPACLLELLQCLLHQDPMFWIHKKEELDWTERVSKDDRSDIESSSDEDEQVVKDPRKPAVIHRHPTTKGENGTNGHLTLGTWAQEH
ncbi:Ceramide synthase 6 [Acipenser ruthenus]|uniref:Ceramide synthase 6 n=1 Tax=Acipenser ruthenus TaxID=7906 RepID=A0A444UXN1_ACIRT|nr:Ceramide synthase 6 [Acipenser ruthenus]